MLKGHYRTYALGLALMVTIGIGVFYVDQRETPPRFLASTREALSNMFGGDKDYVEILDVENYQPTLPEENIRTISASPSGGKKSDLKSRQTIGEVKLDITNVIYDVEGPDEGQERIVIKNNSTLSLSVGDFSIQYLKAGSGYDLISKKNFEAEASISGNGEFIIGVNCSGKTPCTGVDMSWSQALGNDTGAVYLVFDQENIKSDEDPNIIDIFRY